MLAVGVLLAVFAGLGLIGYCSWRRDQMRVWRKTLRQIRALPEYRRKERV